MEVLVAFLDGDTDRPVIIGCLPNAANAVPFPLPASASRSGIRTQTMPGGAGFNELSFEDRAGAELVYLHAEKDLAVETKERHSVTVGGDRTAVVSGDDALSMQVGRRVLVSGEAHEEVAGDAAGVYSGNLSADVMGNRAAWVEGHDAATVGGNALLTVKGDIALSAEGNYILSAGTGDAGEASINVSGNLVAGASQATSAPRFLLVLRRNRRRPGR